MRSREFYFRAGDFRCVLGCVAVLALALGARAQTANERAFPQSRAEVEKALKSVQASVAGRLPSLEGFAQPAEHSLERYQRGYFQSVRPGQRLVFWWFPGQSHGQDHGVVRRSRKLTFRIPVTHFQRQDRKRSSRSTLRATGLASGGERTRDGGSGISARSGRACASRHRRVICASTQACGDGNLGPDSEAVG